LIASSALATQSTGNSNSTPAAQTSQAPKATKAATTHATVKVARLRVTCAREDFASGKDGKSRMERHVRHTTPAKTHQAGRRSGGQTLLNAIACDPEMSTP
jgi:hypothetical protein